MPGSRVTLTSWRSVGAKILPQKDSVHDANPGHHHQTLRHIVRHPMYLGSTPAALGALLMNRTWTALVIAISLPGIILRARREEEALAAQFGQQWQDYAQRVPALIPRIRL